MRAALDGLHRGRVALDAAEVLDHARPARETAGRAARPPAAPAGWPAGRTWHNAPPCRRRAARSAARRSCRRPASWRRAARCRPRPWAASSAGTSAARGTPRRCAARRVRGTGPSGRRPRRRRPPPPRRGRPGPAARAARWHAIRCTRLSLRCTGGISGVLWPPLAATRWRARTGPCGVSSTQACAVVARAAHGAVQADAVGQRKAVDPGLDVVQDLRRQRAGQRQVADGPVGRAELDVLPGRQFAPQPADAGARFEHHRVQPGLARVVQVDDAGNAGADDGDVEQVGRRAWGSWQSRRGAAIVAAAATGGQCRNARLRGPRAGSTASQRPYTDRMLTRALPLPCGSCRWPWPRWRRRPPRWTPNSRCAGTRKQGGPATPHDALRELRLKIGKPQHFEVQYFDFTPPAGLPAGFDADPAQAHQAMARPRSPSSCAATRRCPRTRR